MVWQQILDWLAATLFPALVAAVRDHASENDRLKEELERTITTFQDRVENCTKLVDKHSLDRLDDQKLICSLKDEITVLSKGVKTWSGLYEAAAKERDELRHSHQILKTGHSDLKTQYDKLVKELRSHFYNKKDASKKSIVQQIEIILSVVDGSANQDVVEKYYGKKHKIKTKDGAIE
jgi:hypothetical protein